MGDLALAYNGTGSSSLRWRVFVTELRHRPEEARSAGIVEGDKPGEEEPPKQLAERGETVLDRRHDLELDEAA